MACKEEKILKVLSEDLLQLEDILACMVVRKNLEGIVPIREEFKADVTEIGSMLKDTMNEFFDAIKRYSKYGLDKITFEMGQYDVMFFILPGSDTALVAIVPSLANRGLLEVEMENARRKIVETLESVDP
jgi:predicted regulator of Ras-like GTPase activity (Roadblock/LC7/MglB family)